MLLPPPPFFAGLPLSSLGTPSAPLRLMHRPDSESLHPAMMSLRVLVLVLVATLLAAAAHLRWANPTVPPRYLMWSFPSLSPRSSHY